MTFPQANSDLKFLFPLFSELVHKNVYVTGQSKQSAHSSAHSVHYSAEFQY
jgi:hypothetical protein